MKKDFKTVIFKEFGKIEEIHINNKFLINRYINII